MYLNVLSFKNGRTLAFQTGVPFSVDKLEGNEFLVVTDEVNGQTVSFRTSEVVTIASTVVKSEDKKPTAEDVVDGPKKRTGKSTVTPVHKIPALKTKVTEE